MASLFLLFTALAAQPGGEGAGTGLVALEQYRWQNRLILVFASSPEDPLYLEQRASLARTRDTEWAERDLLIFSCFTSNGNLDQNVPGSAQQAFGPAAAAALRSTLGVAADAFQVVLVGKDGGEKRRSSVPLEATDLLAQIDSMPMRQQEMREQPD